MQGLDKLCPCPGFVYRAMARSSMGGRTKSVVVADPSLGSVLIRIGGTAGRRGREEGQEREQRRKG